MSKEEEEEDSFGGKGERILRKREVEGKLERGCLWASSWTW